MSIANPYGQQRVPGTDKPGSTANGINKSPGVYIGVVKQNNDPQKMGRLKVYIKEWGGDPEMEDFWHSVSYASPFAGSTSIHDQGSNFEEYEDTIKSYGFWAVPPDLDTEVLCAFSAGQLDEGYWFACLYQRGTQISVPGLPAKRTYTGDPLPAAPKNRKDKDLDIEKYVEHKPLSNALKKQGLREDTLRGLTTSSAMREAPSRVLGILTPQQHTFVMDDGDEKGNNRLIRLRTRNGTQLLLDDVAGHIYMISKDGENWVELSDDGHIHVWGSGDINIHSEKNINLRADNDINIEAGNSIHMKAVTKNIHAQAAEEVQTLAGTHTRITSGETSNINSVVAHHESAGVIHMNGPTALETPPIDIHQLTVNQSLLESICNTVPEHEPWAGHSGMNIPIGHGNQQMQADPDPTQTPREAKPDEVGAPIMSPEEKSEALPLEDLKVSESAMNVIKQLNGYSPVNVQDSGGQSGGFGSAITKTAAGGSSLTSGAGMISGAMGAANLPVDSVTRGTEPVANESGIKFFPDEISTKFDSKLVQANKAAETVKGAVGDLSTPNQIKSALASAQTGQLGGTASSPNQQSGLTNILAGGISPDNAKYMLGKNISESESQVKSVLKSVGAAKAPQNVFDGLVSYHNQTGDISYAFIKGEKIDLLPMYKNGEWSRAASFIAADERDRPRRIKEAGMIANNSYGPAINEDNIIRQGFDSVGGLIGKGNLNKQTGDPATAQQLVAAASSYFSFNKKSLPGTDYALNSIIKKNNISNLMSSAKNGPWPY